MEFQVGLESHILFRVSTPISYRPSVDHCFVAIKAIEYPLIPDKFCGAMKHEEARSQNRSTYSDVVRASILF
jgi:hypothetical protein